MRMKKAANDWLINVIPDENIKKSHIGYYLISKGKAELLSVLQGKNVKKMV